MNHIDTAVFYSLGSIGEAVKASTMSPDAFVLTVGTVILAVADNPHVTGGYVIGVLGMMLYYLSRGLLVWLERRNRIAELERRLAEKTVELSRSLSESEELKADLRRWIEHAIGTRPIGDPGPPHSSARDTEKNLPGSAQ